MKKILLIFFILPILVYSQNYDEHKNVIAGLNNYLEFIHETTHLEFMMSNDLMSFNGNIISRSKNPRITLHFNNRDYLNATNYYEQTPTEIYNICINNKFQIATYEKDNLDLHVKNMMLTIIALQKICDSVEVYCDSKKYEQDTNLTTGIEMMEKAKFYFDNYLMEWKLLVSDIKTISAKYEIIDMNNPYIRAAKHLDSLFDVVYNISESARINDTLSVRSYLPKLEYQITKLNGKEEFYLESAESFGRNNGKDPFARFASIIFDAEAQLSYTENFLKKSKYPHYSETTFGKPFYYYNSKFINKFNRHGIGMAYEYNIYADNSHNLVLKMAQIPHTLIVLYPEVPEIIEDEIIEITELTNNDTLSLIDAPPNNLIFLLDVSNSMSRATKMPVLKKSIKFLLTLMREYDYVTIITYSGSAKIILAPTSASNADSITQIIDKLLSGGGTKLYPGLKLAYKSAKKSFIKDGTNRIILATDGNFVITKKISKIVSQNVEKIELSILYFDKYENYFTNLQQLSKLGNGNCTKITEDNINQVLVKEARGE